MATLIGRLRCAFGHHVRSRRHARLDGDAYVSKCKHCGVAMRQFGDNVWRVDDGEAHVKGTGRFLDMD